MEDQMHKNKEMIRDFFVYCIDNPELRFWQALCTWSRQPHILVGELDIENGGFKNLVDTWGWDSKSENKDEVKKSIS